MELCSKLFNARGYSTIWVGKVLGPHGDKPPIGRRPVSMGGLLRRRTAAVPLQGWWSPAEEACVRFAGGVFRGTAATTGYVVGG